MDVRMPDGTIVRNVPDNITQEDLHERFTLYQEQQATPAEAPKKEEVKPKEGTPEAPGFFNRAMRALEHPETIGSERL